MASRMGELEIATRDLIAKRRRHDHSMMMLRDKLHKFKHHMRLEKKVGALGTW